jgi:hypothetical protein
MKNGHATITTQLDDGKMFENEKRSCYLPKPHKIKKHYGISIKMRICFIPEAPLKGKKHYGVKVKMRICYL